MLGGTAYVIILYLAKRNRLIPPQPLWLFYHDNRAFNTDIDSCPLGKLLG